MVQFRTVLLAAAVAIGGAAHTASAATLDFNFSFTNLAPSDSSLHGTVTGIVRGLEDDATSAATSVEVLSNPAGFGLGEYVGSPADNTWTVAGGVITTAEFTSAGSLNSAPAVTDASLGIIVNVGLGVETGAGLIDVPSFARIILDEEVALTFTPVDATAPIPLPASLPLLAGALGLVGWIARRRRA